MNDILLSNPLLPEILDIRAEQLDALGKSFSDAVHRTDVTEPGPVVEEPVPVTCAFCGGGNVELRENRDDSVGYHASELWCNDCQGSAE